MDFGGWDFRAGESPEAQNSQPDGWNPRLLNKRPVFARKRAEAAEVVTSCCSFFSRKLLRSFFCSQRTAAKLKLSLHLHSIYIFLHHLHHLHQLHLDHIHHLHNLHQLQWTSSTLHTSSTSPTSTSSTWHTSIYIINIIYRCSATTYFLQDSHNVIYTGAITRVFTQELLHRTWYTGVLWQSCDTGVVTQE